jgi:serine/threonine protein kinase
MKCIQAVSKQILIAMEYIHSLHIIHSDLKPENILIKSMTQKLIKVIDFGNSVFFHDSLIFYIQTRSYRAP